MQLDGDVWRAALLAMCGVLQAYGLYRVADGVERRTGPGKSTLRPLILVAGLACLWPELTLVGDWLVAGGAERGDLVWALIAGWLLGAVLPRPARRRLPPDATMDEREED